MFVGEGVFHKAKGGKTPLVTNKARKTLSNKRSKSIAPMQLLALERRRVVVSPMEGFLGLDSSRYQAMAESLLHRLAAAVQELPETRNGYFCGRGGFLEHGLSRASAALSLARAYFVCEEGKPAKTLSEEQQLWMYALFSAGLLRGVGKLSTDFILESFDKDGQFIKRHQVLEQAIYPYAKYYDYEFDSAPLEPERQRLTLILARQIMPEAGMMWLASNKEVLNVWLALLDEDPRRAGTLGTILDKADAIAIQKFLQERALALYNRDSDTLGRGSKFSAADTHELAEGELAPGAMEFIKWLTQSLAAGRLMVNKAPLLMVPGGMLMSADIFKLFVRESPMFQSWMAVQQSVEKMGLHKMGADGSATQQFNDTKNHKVVSGLVISALGVVLPEKMKMQNVSNGVIKEVTAKQVIAEKQGSLHMNAIRHSAPPTSALGPNGQWGLAANNSNTNSASRGK